MKKIVLYILAFFIMAGVSLADEVTLNSTETIDTPIAAKIYWYVDYINVTDKTMKIKYRWLTSDGVSIRDKDSSNSSHIWTCVDTPDKYPDWNNVDCTAAGVPFSCCTGPQAGTCNDPSTCFTDVFKFNIRAIDVGTPIGIGLRTLIWNQMKGEILTPGNDGAFDQ